MYWDILVAALVAVIIGFIWYGPLFGNAWRKEMKITDKQMKDAKKKGMSAGMYILMILSAIVMAYVLKLVLVQFPFNSMYAYFLTTFVVWLGFMVPLFIDGVLFDGKSWTLFSINSVYRLIALLAMTAVYLLF